ncbi:MAG: toll/interleukin-1 receptor domain-containing protein, partial [Thermoanaerobaculia bacterium]
MPETFTHDVFLSHSPKDRGVVRKLAGRLKEDGLRVWFLEPGSVEEGLERSRTLVLCLSAHASGPDWAQLEAGTFRFRDPLNPERRFIPLRLDDSSIKGSLAKFLYISWQTTEREQEYPKLLA